MDEVHVARQFEGDVMDGLDALEDLEKVLALGPEHISCYSLQIEEGTPFGEMAAAGELAEVPDEEDRRTYHEICRVLGEAGYEHYEISNFAKPGFRAEHNSLYWNMDDYIAFGLGASGFVSGVRYKNTEDIEEYIALLDEGRLPAAEEHINTAFDNISEAVFTGLRRIEGITYEEAAEVYFRAPDAEGSRPEGPAACRDFFWKIFSEAEKEAEEYAERGLLVIDEKGLRLTEQGTDISNSIMSLFV